LSIPAVRGKARDWIENGPRSLGCVLNKCTTGDGSRRIDAVTKIFARAKRTLCPRAVAARRLHHSNLGGKRVVGKWIFAAAREVALEPFTVLALTTKNIL